MNGLSKLLNGLSQTFKKEEGIMNPKKIFVVLTALVAFALVFCLAPAFAQVEIIPPQVISPNGGEIWGVGSVYNIVWSGGTPPPFTIEYSTNSGGTWLPPS